VATVSALDGFALGSKRAGAIEGVPFFCAFVAILATYRPLHLLVAGDAIPVHGCLEAGLVKMIGLRIFSLEGGGRERINLMASLAGYDLRLTTVSVTPDAVGILFQRPGGMMVAIGAFLRHLDMPGMVKIEWLIQFALIVQGNRIGNGYPPASAWHCCQQQHH